MRVVFMGTPDFAVASLDALVKAGIDVVGVITAPDKPAGRGQKINQSAVKKYAEEHHLYTLQPEKLKDKIFLEQLKALKADLQVVVAFRMLPEAVWNMPAMGTINLHASLLPQYRGAAPINWAVINGENESGVSTFFLKHEIDTGNLIFSEKVAITEEMTAGDLHDELMPVGAELLVKTVQAIKNQSYEETPQTAIEDTILKHAPKIFKDDCQIKWDQNSGKIYNFIRGLSPYPTAFTTFLGKTLKIFFGEKEITPHSVEPGDYISDGKHYLKFATNDGYISIKDLQLEGKKRMKIEEFLRGVKIPS